VSTIGLPGLALFTEADLAIRLDCEGGGGGRGVGRESAVASIVCSASRRCENGGGVAPVEQEIESDADEGC
jgi:hypothetical protein